MFVSACQYSSQIAQVLGGQVERAKVGYQVGVCTYTSTRSHPLASQLPAFRLCATHFDQVVQLPVTAQLLASSSTCPVAAYTVNNNIICFQAHPEFIPPLMESYVHMRKQYLSDTAFDIALRSCLDAPDEAAVAKLIVEFVQRRDSSGRK
jgi:GMP synthase-like glutamine amidotransferase